MTDSETFKKLEDIDERSWKKIYKTLVLYATTKLNRAGFEVRSEKDSVDAEHFATLAVEKLLSGVRKWDYERFPDVTIHLIGIVKSLISSHFKSSTRSIIKAGGEEYQIENSRDDRDYDELTDDEIRTSNIPDEIYIGEELWSNIEKGFEDKDDYVIFSEWVEGSPPRTIAKELDKPVTEINNSIKRGLRIVKKIVTKR